MRPVNKGAAPRAYTDYGQARHDLAERIGYYCSYCEMKVFNSIEVEHILPQNQGGPVLDWDNFLLSCKYCNTIKSDHNTNTNDYLWPDRDNTDLAFQYTIAEAVVPKQELSDEFKHLVKSTIALLGLNRFPGGNNEPKESDTRWRSRQEAWNKAMLCYNRWIAQTDPDAAFYLGIASLSGNYSIWCEVFKEEPLVLQAIDNAYREFGLFKEFEINGQRVIRPNGLI